MLLCNKNAADITMHEMRNELCGCFFSLRCLFWQDVTMTLNRSYGLWVSSTDGLCHVVCVYLFVSLEMGGMDFDESLGNPKNWGRKFAFLRKAGYDSGQEGGGEGLRQPISHPQLGYEN